MSQTLSEVVYHIDSGGLENWTMTGGTLTLTRGSTTLLNMVTATIAPAGANTFHTISYAVPGTVPASVTAGDTVALFQATVNGQAWSSSQNVTILQPITLTPPLSAAYVTLVAGAWVAATPTYTSGDTIPEIAAALSDANGLVDLTTATSAILHVRRVSNGQIVLNTAATITDQTVMANKGVVFYALQANDLLLPQGSYYFEFRVKFAAGTATFRCVANITIDPVAAIP